MGKFDAYWEKLKKVVAAHPKHKPYDDKGQFYPDPTPVAPPVGNTHVADIDMFEMMRSRIRNEMSIAAQMGGSESFEEADDFDVEEEFEPFSPWEEIVDQPVPDGPVVHREPLVPAPPPAPPPAQPAVASPPAPGSTPAPK